MKRLLPLAALSAFSAFLFTSCEPMDAVDPFGLVHDDDKEESNADGSSPQSPSSAGTLTGTWSGRSATGQVSTTLSLTETGGSVSGSLQWPGDRRSVSGTRSGSSVTLHIGGGDTWHLSYSGSSMSGTGYKAGTSRTYRLSFKRR